MRISCKDYLCPIHNIVHSRIGFYALQKNDKIFINCFADIKCHKKNAIILNID